MKTRYTFVYLLTLLLSVLGIQTSQAQATQDALYIYRNDGGFCAFFYGDINHIAYSKIDTLGVEQADYVVQEIYALDTLYRIPLSAIDSVTFVTPETKYKADVFMPDKLISDYITASDSVYWIRLAKNTPASMIPKVGDKLLIEEESKFIPDGFGGLVTSVEEGSDGYTIMTSALSLTDFYEQLVVKVAGASPGMESANARTRGPLDGVDISTPEETISIPSVSQTISLKNSRALLPDNDYVELNGEIQGSLSMSVSPKIRLRAFLTITPFTGFRYYQETFIDTETETAATLSGGLSGRLEVPFLPSPTHTFKKGKLKFELGIGLFLEAQATALSLGFKNTKKQTTRVNMTMDQDDISQSITGIPIFNPYYRWSSYCEKDTTEWELESTGQYSLGFGAFAKAEAKFSIPIEKMPKFVQAWTKTEALGFEATLGIDVGSKVEYAGPVVASFPDLLQTPPFYTELNKANLSLSAYLKFVAGLKCGNWVSEYTPEVKFWEPINRGLVPDILGIGIAQDREEPIRPYRLLFKSPTSDKKVLTGTKVGFAVLDADDKLVTDTLSAYYWISTNEDEWTWNNNKSSYDCVIKLDPGKGDYVTYTAYPMIEFMGHKVLTDQKKEFKLDPARIDIAEREIFLGKDLGYREIEVVPNMENMEVKAEADWLNATKPNWLAHKNELTIYWPDLPGDVNDRRGIIRLIGKSQKGETLVEDSIVVVQFEPFMELTPDKLEFEASGGSQTITIGKTNLKNLEVSTNSEDIQATLNDKIITVTMGENKTSEQRGGAVYVEGAAPDGKKVKIFASVTQKAGKDSGSEEEEEDGEDYLRAPVKLLEANPEGDSITFTMKHKGIERLQMHTNNSYPYWAFFDAKLEDDVVTVILKPNTPLETRKVVMVFNAWCESKNTFLNDTVTILQPPHDKSVKGTTGLNSMLNLRYAYDRYYPDWDFTEHIEAKMDQSATSASTSYSPKGTRTVRAENLEGNRLRVYMTEEYPYDGGGYANRYVTFELPDGYDSEKIENYTYTFEAKDSYWFDSADVKIELTDVPLSKKTEKTDPDGWDTGVLTFSGSLEDGIKITHVKYETVSSLSGIKDEGGIASNPDQNVEISLSWDTNPDRIKKAAGEEE